VEDYARGSVTFESGIVAEIEANNSSGDEETKSIIRIVGTEGTIILSDDKTREWHVPGWPCPEELDIKAIPIIHRPAYYGPGHEKVIDDFVAAVKDQRPPMITAADSLPAMKIIFGFYESAASGKSVLLTPV
jgi:predicted dehydrogenase